MTDLTPLAGVWLAYVLQLHGCNVVEAQRLADARPSRRIRADQMKAEARESAIIRAAELSGANEAVAES